AAVVAVRDVPVSTCVAVRLTPGSTAPLSSKIVPRNSPCASCPSAGDEHTATNARADARNRIVIESSLKFLFSNGAIRNTHRCGTWSVDIVLVRFHGGGVTRSRCCTKKSNRLWSPYGAVGSLPRPAG